MTIRSSSARISIGEGMFAKATGRWNLTHETSFPGRSGRE